MVCRFRQSPQSPFSSSGLHLPTADIGRMSHLSDKQVNRPPSNVSIRTVTSEDLPIEPLLTIGQVALILSVSVKRLYTYSAEGRGPVVTKIEGQIRYRRDDVEAYIEACARNHVESADG